jgi:hypothetical protein
VGVLTDLVVARREDAQRVCKSSEPGHGFHGIEAKRIDPVTIATLHAIVLGVEFDHSLVNGELLASGGEDGPWVSEVSPQLVELLAKLDSQALQLVGDQWSQTEEFEFAGWSSADVHAVLRQMAQLAQRAVAEKKSILLWVCL